MTWKIYTYQLISGGALLLVLLWGANWLSRAADRKLRAIARLDSSLKELFSKLIWVALITCTVLLSLSVMGIDLSAFALVGGAIGLGVGFGIQKIVSNLICGIILLLDRSIKPGDVIALDNGRSYGIVHKLGARCVSVRTRAGKEHLIPNEDFITQKTENWSFSDPMIRLRLQIRTSFEAEPQEVIDLLLSVTQDTSRVLSDPAPGARLVAFGENGFEFELRVWVSDPHNGVSKIKSDLYIKIASLLKNHGIKVPVPQRELVGAGTIRETSSLSNNSQALTNSPTFLEPTICRQNASIE